MIYKWSESSSKLELNIQVSRSLWLLTNGYILKARLIGWPSQDFAITAQSRLPIQRFAAYLGLHKYCTCLALTSSKRSSQCFRLYSPSRWGSLVLQWRIRVGRSLPSVYTAIKLAEWLWHNPWYHIAQGRQTACEAVSTHDKSWVMIVYILQISPLWNLFIYLLGKFFCSWIR